MTRSVGDSMINKSLSTANVLNKNTIIYTLSGQTIDTADTLFASTNSDPLRSLIVIGGDLRIDGDIPKNPRVDTSRAIIVMKNDKGQ